MKKYIFCLSIVLWGMAYQVSSQNPYIRNYTTFDGLPSNTIYNVCQDSRKFIWFATDAGAVRYDGSKFVTFTKREGLNTSKILKIKEDSKGRIWIFNWDGSINYCYRNTIFNSINAPFLDSLKPNEPFHDFFENDDHTIYFFNVMYEIYSLDSNDHVKKHEKVREHFLENLRMMDGTRCTGNYDSTIFSSRSEIFIFNLYRINKTSKGEYLLFTRRGILRVEELFKNPVSLKNYYSEFLRASYSRDSIFYIISFGRYIWKYKEEQLKEFIRMPFDIFYTMSRQNSLLVDKEGNYWIGTFDDGLYCLKEGAVITQNKSLANSASQFPIGKSSRILQHLEIRQVNAIIQDHEGNIWVSSATEGVYKINPYLNTHLHYESSLFQNKGILELAPGLWNGLWLSNGKTVYYLKGRSLHTLDFKEKNTSFNEIYHLKTNKLILGEKYSYFYALYYIKADDRTKTMKFSKSDTSLLYMSGLTINAREDKINCYNYFNFDLIDPDTLFGMYKSGYWQKDFNLGSKIHYTYYNTRDQLIINARKNYMLAGDTCIPAGELSRFDNKVIIQHINLSDKVELMNIENDHIFIFSNNKFYDLSDALKAPPELRIKSICYNDPVLYMADSRNIYWCSNPLDILSGKSVKLSVLDISFRNIHKILSYNDSLYIASDDGLTVIPENKIESIISNVPVPYLESLLVNNKEADVTLDKLILYGRNTLKFTVGTINYSSSPVIYSYMLEGADKDWSSGTSNVIVYKNLPKGDYIFKVRANKPNSGWSETIEYHVRVKYTFWEHPLFFAALVLLVVLLIFFLIVRKKNLQIRRRELDHQLITLEQKALQSMMNPHFIFNSLGSIQNYLMQNKNGEAGQYLSQFARLIRQNLNAINAAMIILEDEADRLKNYLDLEKMRLPNKFEYQIRMDDSLESDEIYIPSMIVQPFVENAVWHGITQLEGKGTVTILFQKESEKSLKITVQDNGIGMKKSAAFSSKKEDHLGLSLDLTFKRLKLLGEKYKVNTTVHFSETIPGAENPGTCVVIIVPVSYDSSDR